MLRRSQVARSQNFCALLRERPPARTKANFRRYLAARSHRPMPSPLAEVLTQLRLGNQKFLLDFYQRSRHLFARWAQRQHKMPLADAHELLQDTLLDFYDKVLDGRITLLPADLRAYLYGMAQERRAAAVPTHQPLPAAEASRRQGLLTQFNLLGADCRQVLSLFYFRGYNFEKMGGKMGFPNATVARLQKGTCLRKLYELTQKAAGTPTSGHDLRPYFQELEWFADGEMSVADQEAFELQLENEPDLTDAHATFEQLTADIRWAAGHDTLRQRLAALDHRMNQRQAALQRGHAMAGLRQRRTLLLSIMGALLLAALAFGVWRWRSAHPGRAGWETYYQPDLGPTVTPAMERSRPHLAETLHQYQSGHYPAALHSLGRISAAEASPDTLAYYRGLILLRQGQGVGAQPYLRRLAEQGSGELARRARYHLGMAYWQAQEPTLALATLRAVAADSLNPYRVTAHHAVTNAILGSQ